MTHRYATMTTISFAALVMVFASVTSAQADLGYAGGGKEATHMTFTYAVRVADVILPAGLYVFRLNPTRHAVWIIGEDDGDVFGPYLTRPIRRPQRISKRQIVVERPADANGIPTLRGWFGRYQEFGYELVYPTPSGN